MGWESSGIEARKGTSGGLSSLPTPYRYPADPDVLESLSASPHIGRLCGCELDPTVCVSRADKNYIVSFLLRIVLCWGVRCVLTSVNVSVDNRCFLWITGGCVATVSRIPVLGVVLFVI
jgi:hypothetical protein